jgi:hypothetical protein
MTRRLMLSRFWCVSIMVLGGMAAAAWAPTSKPVRGAIDWSDQLTSEDRAYFMQGEVLRALPIEYRRALISSMLTGPERSRFWRRTFSDARASLAVTPDQRAVLDAAIAFANADNLEIGLGSDIASRWQSLRQGLVVAFGQEQADRILYMNKARTLEMLPYWERLKYRARVMRYSGGPLTRVLNYLARPVAAFTEWYCDCASTPDCDGEERCYAPIDSCLKNQLCGGPPDYSQWCDSECRLPI